MTAICSSADLNEIPTTSTLKKLKKAQESDESITSWKQIGITQKYDMGYDASASHIMINWLVLVLYSGVYGFVGILFLKLVDKDKR